ITPLDPRRRQPARRPDGAELQLHVQQPDQAGQWKRSRRNCKSPDAGDALALTFAEAIAADDIHTEDWRRGWPRSGPVNSNEFMTMTDPVAERTWRRYEYAKQRGHIDYTQTAWMNEGMYVGGGRQWSPEDQEVLAEEGRGLRVQPDHAQDQHGLGLPDRQPNGHRVSPAPR
ncbi:hypothetical protein ACP3P8_22355, partial [Pseudomonas aeruginosa]